MIANIFLFLFFSLLHPLHLSVVDIHHNPENRSLEITQRLFADDLEDALRQFTADKVDVLNPPNPEHLKKIIGDYVLQNFNLYLNDKAAKLNYLGYEREEEAIWVYFEVTKVPDFRSIEVTNTVFFEMFDDQTNLINVKKGGKIRSMKLDPDQELGRINY